jgi:predicted component of type VI protein secretion system
MVLDYMTVSARHATIRFKNGEFIFTDAGSSNGSYLYLRRPVELTASQSVQFRLGRSMISMKVVNKWNRRLLRAVTRKVTGSNNNGGSDEGDDHSVGSNDDDVRITDNNGEVTRTLHRRTREQIMDSMPTLGTLSQNSPQHMDLLYALAYPKRTVADKEIPRRAKANPSPLLPPPMEHVNEGDDESKAEEEDDIIEEFTGEPDADDEALASGVLALGLDEKEEEDIENADDVGTSLGDNNGARDVPPDDVEEEVAP